MNYTFSLFLSITPFSFSPFPTFCTHHFFILFHSLYLAGKRLLRGIILPLKNQPMNNGIRMRTKPADDDSSDDTASLLSNSAKSSKSVQGFKKLFFGHRKQQQRIKKESLFHKRSKRHSGSTMDSTCSINSSSSSHPTVSPRWSHGSSVAGEVRYICSGGGRRGQGGLGEMVHMHVIKLTLFLSVSCRLP